MIARDRDLLARVGRFNTNLGMATVELMQRQDGGEVPADGLLLLANHLEALATLADDLRARAAELDDRVVEIPSPTTRDVAADG